MDKNNGSSGAKVSQIANKFQRKTTEEEIEDSTNPATGNNVVRTESHAARFNNARLLFEKLGEGRTNRPSTFSIKLPHSNSKEDNLKDVSPERTRSPPSPKKKHLGISNGVSKLDASKIHNVSRLKAEKPEKPEKPERKFNSKELIEKQKNWTSHFSKTRSAATAAPNHNRCDIIRTVPGTGIQNNNEIIQPATKEPKQTSNNINNNNNKSNQAIESPPSPSIRQSIPPEIKPRTTSRSNSLTSPTKTVPNIPTKPSPEHIKYTQRQSDVGIKTEEIQEKSRKKSLDFNEPLLHSTPSNGHALDTSSNANRRHSTDSKDNISLASPAHAISSSPSPGASMSSGPSSPIHTEDEKQENESNEKTEIADDFNESGKFVFL